LFISGIESARPGLIEKYPGPKLHFGDANADVHTVANYYARCSKASIRDVSGWLSRENGAVYITTIYHNFYDNYDDLKLYPGLVDLAHRLD
jgi:hypothetical protein